MKNKLEQKVLKNSDQHLKYRISKLSTGVASIAIGSTLFWSGPNLVRAAQLSPAQQAAATVTDQIDTSKVSDNDLIDQTTATSQTGTEVVTTTTGILDPKTEFQTSSGATSLASAVKNAGSAGVKLSQGVTKTYGDVQSAAQDYAEQIKHLNQVTSAYQAELANYQSASHEYQVAKEAYEQSLKTYEQAQAQYQAYKAQVAKDLSEFQNDPALTNVKQTSSDTAEAESTTTTADVKVPAELQNLVQQAQKLGINVDQTATQTAATTQAALSSYQRMAEQIKQKIADYQTALADYQAKQAVYADQKVKYDQEKQAYDEYQKQLQAGQGAGAVVAAQGLTFEQQTGATMKIDGADTFMTKDVANQLDSQGVLDKFDKAKLDAMVDSQGNQTAYQKTNPNSESEDTWLILKKGQPVTVTYNNLSGVIYNGHPVDHVVYTYTLESSSDGSDEAMAHIMHDPTETIWVGSNTKDPSQHLTTKMDIAFYGPDNQKIDLSDGNAILSLSSLNHYQTLPFITDDGQQSSIKMNHLERVNVGNNEFVQIPGSSVTLNEDNWAYSKGSNQRIAEGATFDADTMNVYVNRDTGEKFSTTDSDISNNAYIKAHGGPGQWVKASQTTGWDNSPAAANGEWPTNKYYGAGAVKLTDGTIYFDVSGNNAGFNTSYWFVINSAIAVPKDPGAAPTPPVKPEIKAEYHKLTVQKTETVTKPVAPKPSFDQTNPTPPQAPSAEWHLAKVVKVTRETVPSKPDEPKPEEPKPGQPNDPGKSHQPHLSRVTRHYHYQQAHLPQTGEKSNPVATLLGMLATLVGLTTAFFSDLFVKRHK